MSKIIISDTSCLIALDRIGHIGLLQKVFTTVYTTQIVVEEFERPLPDWILVKDVININRLEQLKLVLDPGEASAISLALETKNPVLIIDEKKGRKIAQELNITIIGTLKVLLIAKNKGVIVSVKQLIDELKKHSFRFNKAVLDEVLRLAGED
jgi:predicted nucleic acid-binding protein